MKKALKISIFILLVFLAIIIGLISMYFIITKDYTLDKNKLINMNKIVACYDANGQIIEELSNSTEVTPIEKIPSYVVKAFVSIEDKRFYQHNGIDKKALVRATFQNIKSFSFKEGGSTISQQLIKNTHLTNEKTLKRKLVEIKLAKKLEQKYSKNQIMEMYLNTIYFGDNCYGITSASSYYFGKEPQDLSINEGAILASIIKAPSIYSPFHNSEKCLQRKNLVLKEMYLDGYISKTQYEINSKLTLPTAQNTSGKCYDYLYLVKKELNSYRAKNTYSDNKLNVYTSFNPHLQEILEQNINKINLSTDKTAIIIDKNGQVCAYYSTTGEIYRQMGSTAKPIMVYAPAIENNVYDTCSPILDEKTNFNGYAPSNFNDKYYGYVSVKDALSKSLNVCSVKVLSAVGVDNAFNYAKKYDIPLNNQDKNLSLALGSSSKGATLKQIVGAYSTFIGNGVYTSPHCINHILSAKNSLLYRSNPKKSRIYGEDTAFLMNYMLSETVKTGTAKSLSFTNIPLAAKTGTVGNDKGNTDAYCISYNSEYVIGVWIGNADNSLMENSILGGGIPTKTSANVWSEIYLKKTPPQFSVPDSIVQLNIDKITYDNENVIEIADELTPKRYLLTEYFKKNSINKSKSTRFSSPIIQKPEISVNNRQIQIKLCLTEYYDVEIFREYNGNRKVVYDTLNGNKIIFNDNSTIENEIYGYYAIPYYYDGKVKHYGKEIFLGKIKAPTSFGNGAWWDDDI